MSKRRRMDIKTADTQYLANYCRMYFDALQMASGSIDIAGSRRPKPDIVEYVRREPRKAYDKFTESLFELHRRLGSQRHEVYDSISEAMTATDDY